MELTTELSVVLNTTVGEDSLKGNISSESVIKIIYLIIGSLGLTGNIFVVVVIFSGTGMRKQLTNTYIINQSCVDACTSFFLILTSVFEDFSSKYEGVAGELYCRLWLTKMPLWACLVSSTYNLIALTMERYLAIVHPIWHKMKFNRTIVYITIACVWVWGPSYTLTYVVPSAALLPDGSCTTYTQYPSGGAAVASGVATIFVQYIIPLSIISYCYVRMALALRRRVVAPARPTATADGADAHKKGVAVINVKTAGNASTQPKKEDSMARARKNIIKTLAIVAVSFIVCWTWNEIYYLLFNLGYPYVDFGSTFYHFTVVMVFCNCCINPFIYIAKYEQFQKAMAKMFCKWRRRGVTDSETQSTHA